jgi:Putative beta-barrel porin 2
MIVCRRCWSAIGVALVALLSAREVWAQASPILPSTRVFLVGPLSLYPQIALRDAGLDSNVYNNANNARSDLTYSVTPRLFALVPIGNTRFVGTGTGDLVYYRTYADQRSLTTILEGRFEVTSPGFRPFASVGFVGRGDRDGFEIDARAYHTQTTVTAGTDVDVTALTALTAWVSRSTTSYGENEQYLSVSLADQLNHHRDAVAAGARLRPTPLTTILFAAGLERDRFERLPLRDAESLRLSSTVAFDTGAAITGDLQVGFMSFNPRDNSIASYSGLVGSARLHYALPDIVRIDVDANRDVAYSYDPLQPYYLESGGRLTVAQRIIGPIDVIGIGEWREIRNQRIGGTAFDGRREDTTSLGGGVGFQIQRQMRFAMTYERTARTSTEPVGRHYERTRVLGSINYGL